MRLHFTTDEDGAAPCGRLIARVALNAADRLLINTASRGREAPAFSLGTLHASIDLIDSAGRVVGSGPSGFD
ncbi:MAG: hypothetical protein ACI841_003246 [Planctomycetota bacterium]|jgi:hypothetical protein